MVDIILEEKYTRALAELAKEGISQKVVEEALPGAIEFLLKVDSTFLKRGEEKLLLPDTTFYTYRQTKEQLARLGKNYKVARGLLAHFLLEELKKEGNLETLRILQICERGVEFGIMKEWVEVSERKYRLAGAEKGEFNIPYFLGVHFYDFLRAKKWRHFLPENWGTGSKDKKDKIAEDEIALTTYLNGKAREAKAAYDAAHPRPERTQKPTTVTTGGITKDLKITPLPDDLPDQKSKKARKPKERAKKDDVGDGTGAPTSKTARGKTKAQQVAEDVAGALEES